MADPATLSRTEPSRLIGKTLSGRYTVTRMLGEGGMGVVYVARQKLGQTEREVAVKVLHEAQLRKPSQRARFSRECGLLSCLSHPNIVRVYDFGETEECGLFLVMELCKGEPLSDWLERGTVSEAEAFEILRQLCGAMNDVHELGLVHRDLKPDNVLVSRDGLGSIQIKLIDFGIAASNPQQPAPLTRLTQKGMVLGTPAYMSPEQFTTSEVTALSDIYALGVMAYELFSGRLPFEAVTAYEWAQCHQRAEPRPLTGVSEAVNRAISLALRKQPGERPQSALAFLQELGRPLAESKGMAPLSTQTPPVRAISPHVQTQPLNPFQHTGRMADLPPEVLGAYPPCPGASGDRTRRSRSFLGWFPKVAISAGIATALLGGIAMAFEVGSYRAALEGTRDMLPSRVNLSPVSDVSPPGSSASVASGFVGSSSKPSSEGTSDGALSARQSLPSSPPQSSPPQSSPPQSSPPQSSPGVPVGANPSASENNQACVEATSAAKQGQVEQAAEAFRRCLQTGSQAAQVYADQQIRIILGELQKPRTKATPQPDSPPQSTSGTPSPPPMSVPKVSTPPVSTPPVSTPPNVLRKQPKAGDADNVLRKRAAERKQERSNWLRRPSRPLAYAGQRLLRVR